MQKNVASQKLIVFAFDSTTNLPKTGDAGNITAYVSIDYGTVTVLGDTSATEMDSTNAKGYYLFDLTQGETNGNTLLFSAKSSTSNIVVIGVPAVVQTVPSSFVVAPGSANALTVAGSNAATTFAGLTTGALACTTITASGAVAFQSTFAVTTSTSLGALSCTTLTASGAVAFQSTFAVTTSTALAALSATTVTFSGAVAFQSTFAVTTSTSLGALSCTTLTASGAVALQSTLTVTGAVLFSSTFATTGTTTFNALTVTNATTLSGAVSLGSTLGVTGTTTLAALNTGAIGTGNVTITGTLNTSGTTTFNAFTVTNALTVSGTTTLTGTVSATGASNDIRGITATSVTNDVGITQGSADKVWLSAARSLTTFGTLVADVATAVWGAATRLLTAGTNIVLAKGVGITGFNDIAAGTAMTLTVAYDAAKTAGDATAENQSTINTNVLSRLATDSYTAPDNSGIAAIKAKTDSMTFTTAGFIDSNVQYVNDIEVIGTGTSADPWGPA